MVSLPVNLEGWLQALSHKTRNSPPFHLLKGATLGTGPSPGWSLTLPLAPGPPGLLCSLPASGKSRIQPSQETVPMSAEPKAPSAYCKSGSWVSPEKGMSRVSRGRGRSSLCPWRVLGLSLSLSKVELLGLEGTACPPPHPLPPCDTPYRRSRYARSPEKVGVSLGGGQQKPRQEAWPGKPGSRRPAVPPARRVPGNLPKSRTGAQGEKGNPQAKGTFQKGVMSEPSGRHQQQGAWGCVSGVGMACA